MLFLYLDESGDLGFDFVNKHPSRHFTICVLAVNGIENNRKLAKCVKKTIVRRTGCNELKGSDTELGIKQYFYDLCKDLDFRLYAITLNKKRVYEDLTREKERVYNYVAKLVIDKIPIHNDVVRINIIVDKSKAKPEMADFNQYILQAIQGKVDPKVPLDIEHQLSHENKGLQAVDMFCWGVFRKYEKNDERWLDVYRKNVKYESLYLPYK